jgi:hypothetical protein
MILKEKRESGQIRRLILVVDNRGAFTIGKLPELYFDAAFDYRWIRGRKIVPARQPPEQDRLSIGAIAAEQLTKEEFSVKFEAQVLDQVLDEAKKIINPK